MEPCCGRRPLRPVEAASKAVVVPVEGATAAHFVAPSGPPGGARTAGTAALGDRLAPTLALFSAQRRAVDIDAERMRALAVGDEPSPVARAPRKDHEFCNPPGAGDVGTITSARRAASDKRRASYLLRDALRPISVRRCADCGHRRIALQVEVVRRRFAAPPGQAQYRAHYRGILRCGSGWECPVCGWQIRAERSREVEQAVAAWGLERLVMLSLTVRHGLGHDLRTVRQGVTRAYCRLTRGAPWKRFKARFGLCHSIRALEVTRGSNGWHPHLHVQLFLDQPLNEKELADAKEWLRERWATCIERELGAEHIPNDVHGVDLRPSRRGDYGFKMALEMAEAGSKRARRGHRTPWQIAADYAAHGAAADARLWRNYCAGMRGAQMHHWSRGLREAVSAGAKQTEQEIVDGDRMPDDEVVAILEPSAWSMIACGGARRTLAVLEAAEKGTTAAEADSQIRCVARGKPRGS